jgi:hypothetical protein
MISPANAEIFDGMTGLEFLVPAEENAGNIRPSERVDNNGKNPEAVVIGIWMRSMRPNRTCSISWHPLSVLRSQ